MATKYPYEYEPEWVECWQCGGDGFVSSCFEEFACIDPDEGCEDCQRKCDVCEGGGGWDRPDEDDEEPALEKLEEK